MPLPRLRLSAAYKPNLRRADDALWRRTKQGMWLNADQQSRVSQWLVEYTQQKLSLAS